MPAIPPHYSFFPRKMQRPFVWGVSYLIVDSHHCLELIYPQLCSKYDWQELLTFLSGSWVPSLLYILIYILMLLNLFLGILWRSKRHKPPVVLTGCYYLYKGLGEMEVGSHRMVLQLVSDVSPKTHVLKLRSTAWDTTGRWSILRSWCLIEGMKSLGASVKERLGHWPFPNPSSCFLATVR